MGTFIPFHTCIIWSASLTLGVRNGTKQKSEGHDYDGQGETFDTLAYEHSQKDHPVKAYKPGNMEFNKPAEHIGSLSTAKIFNSQQIHSRHQHTCGIKQMAMQMAIIAMLAMEMAMSLPSPINSGIGTGLWK